MLPQGKVEYAWLYPMKAKELEVRFEVAGHMETTYSPRKLNFEMMNQELEIKPMVFSQKLKKNANSLLIMKGYIEENKRILRFYQINEREWELRAKVIQEDEADSNWRVRREGAETTTPDSQPSPTAKPDSTPNPSNPHQDPSPPNNLKDPSLPPQDENPKEPAKPPTAPIDDEALISKEG